MKILCLFLFTEEFCLGRESGGEKQVSSSNKVVRSSGLGLLHRQQNKAMSTVVLNA